jgi:beta-phosphoglucomutase
MHMVSGSALQGYIFDMDGTLVDNLYAHEKAWEIFLKRHQIQLPDGFLQQNNQGTILEIIPRIFGATLSKEKCLQLGNEKEQIYRELYRPHIAAVPGLINLLQAANAVGLKLALATMADLANVEMVLNTLKIGHLFDAVVTGADVNHGKPNPEVFLKAAHSLNLPVSSLLIFEDSLSGVQAGVAANISVVGINTSQSAEKLLQAGVKKVIENYHDVVPGIWPF